MLAFPSISLAAKHYVWCGASGGKTGADFTNAYPDLPASLTRGDTYYVEGSSSCPYGPHALNDALSGTNVISVLHVTSAESGVTGYASAMATTPANWGTTTSYGTGNAVWIIQQGYYTDFLDHGVTIFRGQVSQ